ncbi:TRAP transporter permease [Clostridium formicaceticum]|uniref:C4-dicarboxylate ABC transporter permease n=1 Tax=Clostridium formicaceticum TaxID=1497 RepID=A0AAC9RJM1_9CLOT|nr:TRAP transporter permease [Clostridium formicaceticum]AOY76493.1 C4-dicarboxylate ABC transporter permease [Clostridium formicaceticum]ARE86902.1 Sialic acid TRAP transporter permease protein SiaT [Clostridium formicaceticum]
MKKKQRNIQDSVEEKINVDEKLAEFDTSSNIRNLKGLLGKIIAIIAIVMSIFHLYTAGFGTLLAMKQRSLHLLFVFVLGFVLYPIHKNSSKTKVPFYDWIFTAGGVMVTSYILFFYEDLVRRGGRPTSLDLFMGILAIFLVLEVTRRSIGPELPIIAVIAIAYVFVGPYLPGALGHRGYNIARIVNQLYMTTEGIFGTPLGVSSTFVFMFILFGSFLEVTGVGQFFIDVAFAMAGHRKGGPAKAAVVASGFMGSISGSSIANTVTTGAFTIPLMKKVGYKPNFAGAVEAAASTGGQILPPVMGAAAFIMSEFTNIPYITIVVSAFIPALLYYLGVIVMVHLQASKQNLQGMPKEELPDFKKTFKMGFHLLLPLVGVVLFLIRYSPLKAALLSIIVALGVSLIRSHTRIKPKDLFIALEDGAKKAVSVAAACACAGIIVGIVTLTGLGLTFANLIINLAGGMLLPTLFLTMVASIILGMGLPTTAKYIVLATMAAPALTELGVPVIAAHLFILYFGVIADVTPPVALAAYAGAGIAGGDSFKTGIQALKLGSAGFIIPYIFAMSPALLLIDVTIVQAIVATITACLGVVAFASGVQGYFLTFTKFHERIMFLLAALFLIHPNMIIDFAGLALLVIPAVLQYSRYKSEKTQGHPIV